MGSCSGVLGLFFNDVIGCGDDDLYSLTDATGRLFDVKPKMFPAFEFAGTSIETPDYRCLANQSSYAMALGDLSLRSHI